MNCDVCQKNLAAFLDDQLAARERQALQAHMNACAECARLYQELQEVDRIFQDQAMVAEPAAQTWDKIQTEIVSSKGEYRSPGRRAVAFGRRLFKLLTAFSARPGRYARAAAACATVLVALSLFLGAYYYSSYKTKQQMLAEIGKVRQEYLRATDRNPFSEAVRTERLDDNPFRTIDLKSEKNPFRFAP